MLIGVAACCFGAFDLLDRAGPFAFLEQDAPFPVSKAKVQTLFVRTTDDGLDEIINLGCLFSKGCNLFTQEELFFFRSQNSKWAAVAPAFVMITQVGLHRRLGGKLHLQVHAGLYFEAATVELFFTVGVFKVAPNLFGEISRVSQVLIDARANDELLRRSLVCFFLGDEALADHAA